MRKHILILVFNISLQELRNALNLSRLEALNPATGRSRLEVEGVQWWGGWGNTAPGGGGIVPYSARRGRRKVVAVYMYETSI